MSSDPAALVVFARLPIPGKAKTRLAKDVGDANAAEFYARMAERIFTVTSRCERISSRTVFFSERGEEDGALSVTPTPTRKPKHPADEFCERAEAERP